MSDGAEVAGPAVEPRDGVGTPDGFRRLWTPHRLAYIKEAAFVPSELKEKWPTGLRATWLTRAVNERGVARLAELSHPVVECGVYDAAAGTAVVLANFTYQQIDMLQVRLPVRKPVATVRSAERGPLEFEMTSRTGSTYSYMVTFAVPLALSDIVVLQ